MLAPTLFLRLQYALTAAALDAFCVTRLGGPFASVITGNLVHVGGGVAAGNSALAAGCGIAVGAYAAGAAVLREATPGWTVRTTLATLIEFVLIAAVAGAWRGSIAAPRITAACIMLALDCAAMGLQSAATLTSGVRGAATTYVTGTLTMAVRTMVAVPHGPASGFQPLVRLAALLAGAVGGGLVERAAAEGDPTLPAAIVAAVVVLDHGLGQRTAPPGVLTRDVVTEIRSRSGERVGSVLDD